MKVTHKVVIDLAQNNYIEVEVSKGSVNTIFLMFFLMENGKKYDMSDVGVVSFKAVTPDKRVVFNDTSRMEADGRIIYEISETIMDAPGKTTAVLQLVGQKGEIIDSFEFYIKVKAQLYDENAFLTGDDLEGFRSYMLRAEKAAEQSNGVKDQLNLIYGNVESLVGQLTDTKEDYELYLEELKNRVENGELKGPKGDPGENGADAVVVEGTGALAFQIIGTDLYCYYFGDQPDFSINMDGDLVVDL